MSGLRLVVFDVDGTLVDSQAHIVAAMAAAFGAAGRAAPDRAEVLGIVGLSLDAAVAHLAPDADAVIRDRIVAAYRDAYFGLRGAAGVARSSPLFDGAAETVERLAARPGTLLGIATGKSRRGLDALLDGHGLRHHFVTLQVADDHPSKPHPSMLLAALADTGVAPRDAVMVGDTRFDLDMAHAAGVPSIAVGWGYHSVSELAGATALVERFDALAEAIDRVWGAKE